jgi:hypothetical protein
MSSVDVPILEPERFFPGVICWLTERRLLDD